MNISALGILLLIGGLGVAFSLFRLYNVLVLARFKAKTVFIDKSYIEQKVVPARLEEVIRYRPVVQFSDTNKSNDQVLSTSGFKPNIFWYNDEDDAKKVLEEVLSKNVLYFDCNDRSRFAVSNKFPKVYLETTVVLIVSSSLLLILGVFLM